MGLGAWPTASKVDALLKPAPSNAFAPRVQGYAPLVPAAVSVRPTTSEADSDSEVLVASPGVGLGLLQSAIETRPTMQDPVVGAS